MVNLKYTPKWYIRKEPVEYLSWFLLKILELTTPPCWPYPREGAYSHFDSHWLYANLPSRYITNTGRGMVLGQSRIYSALCYRLSGLTVSKLPIKRYIRSIAFFKPRGLNLLLLLRTYYLQPPTPHTTRIKTGAKIIDHTQHCQVFTCLLSMHRARQFYIYI